MVSVLLQPLNSFVKVPNFHEDCQSTCFEKRTANLVNCPEKKLLGAALMESTENTALITVPQGANVS